MNSKTEKKISSVIFWLIGICFFILPLAFATPWAVYGYVEWGYADTKEKKEWCANINAKDNAGKTPFDVAGNNEIRLLLKNAMENK